MRPRHPFARVIVWALLAAFVLPPSPVTAAPAADRWTRVAKLKPYSWVIVTLDDDRVLEGWLVSARATGMVVEALGVGPVDIARGHVKQVAEVRQRRPWYTVPAVVGAVAAGVGLIVAMAYACRNNECADVINDSEGIFALLAAPVLAGIWAYRKLESRRFVKVIYEAA